MQEDPRLGRDVVGEQQLLAAQSRARRRLAGPSSTARSRRSRRSGRAAVGSLRTWDVDLGAASVDQDPRRLRDPLVRRRRQELRCHTRRRPRTRHGGKVAEVDPRLAERRGRRRAAAVRRLRSDLGGREADQAEPMGVGRAGRWPTSRLLAGPDRGRARGRSPRSARRVPSTRTRSSARLVRAVVRRLGDELAHPRLEHPGSQTSDVGRACVAQRRDVGRGEAARSGEYGWTSIAVEPEAAPGRRDRPLQVRLLAEERVRDRPRYRWTSAGSQCRRPGADADDSAIAATPTRPPHASVASRLGRRTARRRRRRPARRRGSAAPPEPGDRTWTST